MSFPISSLAFVIAGLVYIMGLQVAEAAQLKLKPGEEPALNARDAEASLINELANGTVNHERLARLEEVLRPTYDALPKSSDGHLGHQAVRYALHRLMVHQHSWYIRGLEPSDTVPPPYLHSDWVPAYLQGLLEQRFGESGINLHELAALAASLEDLVRMEASSKLEGVYNLHELPTNDVLNSTEVDDILSTYMMMYLREGDLSFLKPDEVQAEKLWFAGKYSDWTTVIEWVTEIKNHHVSADADGSIRAEFSDIANMATEINERFGSLNDKECRSLKSTLMEIEESRQPGRVRLSAFYKKGLYSHWRFNEKIGYLRKTGVLDESDPKQARVILPNYLSSRTNCLDASSLYTVCCRNECEELIGHLEGAIAAPMADPARVWELVSKLPSDTVAAPRNLSSSLLARLGEISGSNGGKVPLHGRLFAQWMHHAFPRECPYPHEAGIAAPQTPDEWMKETGEEDARTSEEEMLQHVVNDTCPVGGCYTGSAEEEDLELPWSSVEELLVAKPLVSVLPGMYHDWAVKYRARACGDAALSEYEFGCCMFGCEDGQVQPKELIAVERGVSLCAALVFLVSAAFTTYQRQAASAATDSTGKGLPFAFASSADNDPRKILMVCSFVLAFNAAGLLHRGVFALTLCGGLIFFVVLPSTARCRGISGPRVGKQV